MSIHANKAIVRRLLEEAWNQTQLAEIDAYVAADRVHHSGTGVGPQGPEVAPRGDQGLADGLSRPPVPH